MNEGNIIYSSTPPKFIKRFWNLFRYYFFISVVSILFVILTVKDYNFIVTIAYLIIIIFLFLSPFFSSYKWAKNKVIKVTKNDSQFTFETLNKDKEHFFCIDSDKITTKLKWQGGRPRILKLSIYDEKNKVIDLYSAGKSNLEYELELIAYEINQKIK